MRVPIEWLREYVAVPDDKIFIVHNFPDQGYFPLADVPASWPKKVWSPTASSWKSPKPV